MTQKNRCHYCNKFYAQKQNAKKSPQDDEHLDKLCNVLTVCVEINQGHTERDSYIILGIMHNLPL